MLHKLLPYTVVILFSIYFSASSFAQSTDDYDNYGDFAVDSTKIPSVVESGEFTISYDFVYKYPRAANITSYYQTINLFDTSRNEPILETVNRSLGLVTYDLSLEPGEYLLSSDFSFFARYPRDDSDEEDMQEDLYPQSFTVTGRPQGVNKVFTTPEVLDANNCNATFSLYWEKDSDPGVISAGGKVLYTIEEESALESEDFTGNWLVLENAYESVDHTPAGATTSRETYEFKTPRSPGRKYRYRVSTRYVVGQHTSAVVSNHEDFGSIRKHDCSKANDAVIADIRNVNDKTILNAAPPSSIGVSVNLIENFDGEGFNVKNKPLVINNFVNSQGKAAELIVIESSRVHISQPISILGQNAALMIINNNTSSSAFFECVGLCQFQNTNRVTLANAKPDDEYGTGALQINKQSTMRIKGLLAPGAHSVEIMGGKVSVEGFLTTHLKARKRFGTKHYELSETGNLSAGVGSIGIYAGGFTVNYSSLDIERFRPLNSGDKTVLHNTIIKGNIESTNINIQTTENLQLDANLNTHSDILTTQMYKKKSYIKDDINKIYTPVEGVRVESFGEQAQVNMNGSVITKADSNVFSNHHLTIKNAINAKSLNLIAGEQGRLLIGAGAALLAEAVNAAAYTVENNGTLAATNEIDVSAMISLVNQYGGQLKAPKVKLTSILGYVRNGSLVPYKQRNNEAAIAQANASQANQQGTYYDIANKDTNSNQVLKVNDLSAKVIAKNLEVFAATSIENINPYFIVNRNNQDWSDRAPFNKRLSDQVSLLATQSIKLKAGQKIINSSAKIMQLNSSGSVEIASRNLTNQRYRSEIILDGYYVEQLRDEKTPCQSHVENCDDNEILIESNQGFNVSPIIHSPPGVFYVAGDFNADPFTSSSNALDTLNDTSYFEVMGGADVFGTIVSVGVLDYDLVLNSFYDSCHRIEFVQDFGDEHHSGNSFHECVNKSTSELTINYIGEMDALFRVHGEFKGEQVNWVTTNEDAALAFIAKATNTSLQEIYGKKENHTLSDFIKTNFRKIKDYIDDFKNTLLGAWDSITDWFS